MREGRRCHREVCRLFGELSMAGASAARRVCAVQVRRSQVQTQGRGGTLGWCFAAALGHFQADSGRVEIKARFRGREGTSGSDGKREVQGCSLALGLQGAFAGPGRDGTGLDWLLGVG